MQQISAYLFFLLMALILLAYYVGLKTDATAAGQQVQGILKASTGRNDLGNFAAYPQGGL